MHDVRFCLNKIDALFNVGFCLSKFLWKKHGAQSLEYARIGFELFKFLPR